MNTRRPVAAALTLAAEIGEVLPEARLTYGHLDGYGRDRSLTLDWDTVHAMRPLLDHLHDPRIIAIDIDTVHFVPDSRADSSAPFGIADAYRVLTGSSLTDEPREQPGSGEDEPEQADDEDGASQHHYTDRTSSQT